MDWFIPPKDSWVDWGWREHHLECDSFRLLLHVVSRKMNQKLSNTVGCLKILPNHFLSRKFSIPMQRLGFTANTSGTQRVNTTSWITQLNGTCFCSKPAPGSCTTYLRTVLLPRTPHFSHLSAFQCRTLDQVVT